MRIAQTMINKKPFGRLQTGEAIDEYTLSNEHGLFVRIITYGGIIRELHVPDRTGRLADVTLGLENLAGYEAGHPYFGCITGRIAGRLTHGKFSLEGKNYALAINNPPNHLHGGYAGLSHRVWTAEVADAEGASALRLSYISPDGEEGYPGTVSLAVTYSLTSTNSLVIAYEAVADRATPLSLTNHAYFNLGGEGSGRIDDHILQIFADDFVPTDENMTLLDRRERVAGRANDFTSPKRVGDALPGLWKNHGDNYFIRENPGWGLAPVARLVDPASGRVMDVASSERCLQFYTGVSLDGSLTGKSGTRYVPHSGLCLECQGYPNGINRPHLGNIVLPRAETYRQKTVYTFSVNR